MIITPFSTIVVIGLIAILLSLIAIDKGYFYMPKNEVTNVPLTLGHLSILLLIFLSISFGFSRIIASLILPLFHLIKFDIHSQMPAFYSTANFLLQIAFLIGLFLFFTFTPKQVFTYIWKRDFVGKTTLFQDLLFGALSWFILYPYILLSSSLLEFFSSLFFHINKFNEQVAIAYLKSTMDTPFFFILTLISIILFAPIIEEFIFRGFILNYLKKWMGRWGSILLSSTLFSLFHLFFFPEHGGHELFLQLSFSLLS